MGNGAHFKTRQARAKSSLDIVNPGIHLRYDRTTPYPVSDIHASIPALDIILAVRVEITFLLEPTLLDAWELPTLAPLEGPRLRP